MKTFIILSLLFFAIAATAQVPSDEWCAKKEYTAIVHYNGDVIKVTCDTVFLINPATYRLYDMVFKNHKAMNNDVKRLTVLYDYTKTLYENRIQEQNAEYTKLKQEFDALATRSQNLVQATTTQLSDVSTSLTRIDQSILKANEGIEEAKGLIRTEMKNAFKQRLKWGVGGFVVGVTAAALIVAATQ
jgi:hypothetical protein